MLTRFHVDMLSCWGLSPGETLRGIELAGSPERCRQRQALVDAQGKGWILELLHAHQTASRERIALLLEQLGRELPFVLPYRKTLDGSYVLRHEGRHWQLSPLLAHEPLLRPEYIHDSGMGASLGGCLLRLYAAGKELSPELMDDCFSLPAYVQTLLQTMERAAGEHVARARALASGLAFLWERWECLPRSFCHGDLHPLNALWDSGTQGGVLALIDWEFCGRRPRLYDLANCLGCVGIENPAALRVGFAAGLLEEVRADLLQGEDAALLPELLLALRFAWLSEWLRHRDVEMISLELDYMELLSRSLDRLRGLWRL